MSHPRKDPSLLVKTSVRLCLDEPSALRCVSHDHCGSYALVEGLVLYQYYSTCPTVSLESMVQYQVLMRLLL